MNIWEKIVNDLRKTYPQCVHNGVVDLNDILNYLHVEANILEMLNDATKQEIADVEFMQKILNEVEESNRIIKETIDEVNNIYEKKKKKIVIELV